MITFAAAMKYAVFPDIASRSLNLFASGFCYIAFFLAQIYRAAGLLPSHHPYLIAANFGRFGIRHVISEGLRCTSFSLKNIDKLGVFALLMIGIFMLFSQLVLLMISFVSSVAVAATADGSDGESLSIFATTQPGNDIAFVLLDQVFGIEGMYNSCVATQAEQCLVPIGPFPTPFHEAMHSLFQFYSVGLLVVACIIFTYFVFAILAETAQSGTPFGRRFNHVWAPIRLVVAIGLLIPINHGLNSAQYVTLYAAKFGSGFATNGWFRFVDAAVGSNQGSLLAIDGADPGFADSSGDRAGLVGDSGSTCSNADSDGDDHNSLVACPNPPPLNVFMEFFTAVATCNHGMNEIYNQADSEDKEVDIGAYVIRTGNMESNNNMALTAGTTLEDILAFNGESDIEIVFGHAKKGDAGTLEAIFSWLLGEGSPAEDQDQAFKGDVIPYCGIMKIQLPHTDRESSPGGWEILNGYLDLIVQAWEFSRGFESCEPDSGGIPFGNIGACMVEKHIRNEGSTAVDPIDNWAELLTYERVNFFENLLAAAIQSAVIQQGMSDAWVEDLKKYGWAGAAIWYNKIAQLNGTLISSAYNLPIPLKYPMVMEEVKHRRAQQDQAVAGPERFQPSMADGREVVLEEPREIRLANALYFSQKKWEDVYTEQEVRNNAFIDTIQLIFGLDGIYSMRDNIERGVHPLAALSAIGRSLLESSIRNMGASFFAGLAGGVANLMNRAEIGAFAETISSFMMTFAMIGISIGFVLFYVIPFLPFIYFFFAVGGWVKGVFEAMVGVPLWALAHIRIDGNGLPGDAAINGYYLILEIFLRPILIVFGLLAGIVIFSAQMTILNQIWDTVVSNVSGFDHTGSEAAGEENIGSVAYFRGHVDQFFFTVVYAIIGYMMAMASFKLVDQIPNFIMRWMGANVSTFGDQNDDAAKGLVQSTFFGGQMVTGGITQATSGIKQTVQGLTGAVRGPNPPYPEAGAD